MSFCIKDKQFVSEGMTVLDNKFILAYMPDAPEKVTQVYLLGLALCNETGVSNSVEAIAEHLSLTPEDVIDAFLYWDEMGLVQLINSKPPQVVYLPITDSTLSQKKVSSNKYAKFSKEIQKVISGRLISTTEYNEYFLFLENSTMEWEALIAVAKYCVDFKGNDINYPYVLAVARAQAKKGACTVETVSENLNSQGKYDVDISFLFKTMNLKRKIEHKDRENYEKWTKDFGYTLDIINGIAQKAKSMEKIDALLEEYFSKGVFSEQEIDEYARNKQALYDTAKAVTKNLGLYYQSLEPVVDEYVCKWQRYGYDQNTLVTLAKYCFRNNVRTLSGMDGYVEKFCKLGCITLESIDDYIAQVIDSDEQIKTVLAELGLNRNVCASDRKLFKIWTEVWGLSIELIRFGASKSIGAGNPIMFLNKVLSTYKTSNVATVEQAKNVVATTAFANTHPTENGKPQIEQHQYTDEQLSALFTDLNNVDI